MQIPRKPVPSHKVPNSAFEVTELPPHSVSTSSASQSRICWPKPIAAVLDKYLPPHRKYLRLRRRNFLLVLLALTFALLALIIGLSVGLTLRARSNAFLPLPSSSQAFTGDLTYYSPGLGACGQAATDSDSVVSVSHSLFDAESKGSDPNSNPLCGLRLRAQRYNEEAGGMRSVDLKVVDRCVGCQPTDIDVSPSAFTQLANADLGRVKVTWAWLDNKSTA